MGATVDFVKVWLGRVLAIWIAGLATKLAVKYGIVLDEGQQKAAVENMVGLIIPVVMTIYAVVHKLLDKHLNPGDAASTHIAAQEAREHDRMTR